MSKIIPKKPALVYNSIEHQSKTTANSLTIGEWNRVVNILKQQANLNTKYLEDLHRMLFYDWNSDDSGYAVGEILQVFYEHPEGANLSNKIIDVYDENVVFDLEEGVDLTCHGVVESITINLKGVRHGYYSGVNFKTSEQEELLIPSLQVVNESLLPLKFVRWNKILSIEEITFKPNATINMTFYSDGINIYGYVMEA